MFVDLIVTGFTGGSGGKSSLRTKDAVKDSLLKTWKEVDRFIPGGMGDKVDEVSVGDAKKIENLYKTMNSEEMKKSYPAFPKTDELGEEDLEAINKIIGDKLPDMKNTHIADELRNSIIQGSSIKTPQLKALTERLEAGQAQMTGTDGKSMLPGKDKTDAALKAEQKQLSRDAHLQSSKIGDIKGKDANQEESKDANLQQSQSDTARPGHR